MMMMQWRKSLWWWGVRPSGFAPGWGDTSVSLVPQDLPEFADAPMRVSGRRRQTRAQPAGVVTPALKAMQAITVIKAFLHDQVCDLDALRARQASRSPSASSAPGVLYRHPLHDLSWDGHGRQPQWLRDALLQEGWLLVDLRLAGQPMT